MTYSFSLHAQGAVFTLSSAVLSLPSARPTAIPAQIRSGQLCFAGGGSRKELQ